VDATGTRKVDLGRGLRLEFVSLAYNLFEAVVGIAAGVLAGSVALVGFGLDAVIESASAGILVWRLRSEVTNRRASADVERTAVRFVSIAFFVLALYVGASAVYDLANRARPEDSPVGIALAILSLIVMPVLAARKRAVARALDSRSLEADSRQTILCTYLSGVLLLGLVANSLLGWWWADPVAGLGIALLAADEGRELWKDHTAHHH
jgi:divalent metal cation (Fe/Co/Zn/Cd) transporter